MINDFGGQDDDLLDVLDSDPTEKSSSNNDFFIKDQKKNPSSEKNKNNYQDIDDIQDDFGKDDNSEFDIENLREKNAGDFHFGDDDEFGNQDGENRAAKNSLDDDFSLDEAMDGDDFENRLDQQVQETPTEENELNMLDDFPDEEDRDSVFTGKGGFLEGSSGFGGQDDFRFSTAKPSKFGNSQTSSEKKQSVVTFGNNQDLASAQTGHLKAINEEDGVIGGGEDDSFNIGDDFLGDAEKGSGFDDIPVDDDPFELDGEMDDW